MRKITSIIIASVLLFMCDAAFAQKQTPPAGGTPKDFVLPSKKQTSLPNGMRSTLVQYGQLPKVYVNLIIKTGSIHEPADKVWLTDLLAKLMNEGTTSMSATELAKKAAGMGGSISVNAGSDQFTIYGSALSEYAPELIKMIADVAINPAMPGSEVERLKSDLKRQIAIQKGVPQTMASEKFFNIMYGDSPYGRTMPTEEQVGGYTLDDVKKFYNNNMGAKRSVLYVAGKFDEAAAEKAIASSFKQWQAGPEPRFPEVENNIEASTTIIDRKNAPQTTVMIGIPSITPKNPDYLPVSIMNSLLGGSFASRITSNIRENKGYTYSPFSTFSTHPNAAVWYEQADITSEHTIDAINEIKKEVVNLQTTPPTADELLGIQRYAAGIFVLQNSTPNGIIGQLNFLDLYGLPESFLTNRVKNIYAVTPQQVTDLTKKYLSPEKMVVVMVGDEASIKEQQSRSGTK